MTETAIKKKSKMTLEMDKETLAELKAAAIIFGAKSYSSLVHQQVILKIREAKQIVTKDEFDKLREEQMEKIAVRSKVKSDERRKIDTKPVGGEEILEDFAAEKKPKTKPARKNSRSVKTKDGEVLRFVEEDDGFDEEK